MIDRKNEMVEERILVFSKGPWGVTASMNEL
jgi:hypothetical protein